MSIEAKGEVPDFEFHGIRGDSEPGAECVFPAFRTSVGLLRIPDDEDAQLDMLNRQIAELDPAKEPKEIRSPRWGVNLILYCDGIYRFEENGDLTLCLYARYGINPGEETPKDFELEDGRDQVLIRLRRPGGEKAEAEEETEDAGVENDGSGASRDESPAPADEALTRVMVRVSHPEQGIAFSIPESWRQDKGKQPIEPGEIVYRSPDSFLKPGIPMARMSFIRPVEQVEGLPLAIELAPGQREMGTVRIADQRVLVVGYRKPEDSALTVPVNPQLFSQITKGDDTVFLRMTFAPSEEPAKYLDLFKRIAGSLEMEERKAEEEHEADAFHGFRLDPEKRHRGDKAYQALPRLYVEAPSGSGQWEVRDEVEVIYSGGDGSVFFRPNESLFYIETHQPASAIRLVHGPFEGIPVTRIDLPEEGLTEYGRTLAASQGLEMNLAVPEEIANALRELLKRSYPQATFEDTASGGLKVAFQVADFELPAPPEGGGRRFTPRVKGPQKGGILCEIDCMKGKYNGAMELTPEGVGSLDRTFFKVLVLAPYSTDRDAHLWVRLSYPPDADPEFVGEFRKIVMSFAG